jgi:hypothetical protein
VRIAKRVDRTSTAENKHTCFPYVPDCFAECNMSYWVQTPLDRKLDNRHVSLGEHESQRYPCSMIETPGRIEITGETCRFEKIDHMSGEIRTPLSWIIDEVQFRGKPEKIVNRLKDFSGSN